MINPLSQFAIITDTECWIYRLSSGFESILESLLGPELLDELKLFKGKNVFLYTEIGHDHTTTVTEWQEWFENSLFSAHYCITILLHCTIWYPSTFTLQDSPWLQKRRCLVSLQKLVFWMAWGQCKSPQCPKDIFIMHDVRRTIEGIIRGFTTFAMRGPLTLTAAAAEVEGC